VWLFKSVKSSTSEDWLAAGGTGIPLGEPVKDAVGVESVFAGEIDYFCLFLWDIFTLVDQIDIRFSRCLEILQTDAASVVLLVALFINFQVSLVSQELSFIIWPRVDRKHSS
jgi:hypothetical protein